MRLIFLFIFFLSFNALSQPIGNGLPSFCITGESPVRLANGTWGCGAPGGSIALDEVSNVDAPSPLLSQYLKYDGTNWTSSYPQEVITHLNTVDFVENEYTLTSCFGIIEVDTSGAIATLTLKLPDSTAANNGNICRVYLSDATQTLNITTVGGTQLIGGAVTQTIESPDKGISLVSDFTDTRYLIPQSNRFDTTTSVKVTPATDGVSSMDTLQDYFNFMGSSTYLSGGNITDNGDGTVDITESEWMLRTGATDTSTLQPLVVPAITNLSIADNVITNVIVNYNSGSPQYETSPYGITLSGNTN